MHPPSNLRRGAWSVGLVGLVALAIGAAMWPRGSTVATTQLGIPGHSNAFVSAASAGALVVLVWAASSPDAGTQVLAAVSRDDGVSFGAPVRVNAGETDASVNGERPPRAAILERDGSRAVVVVWSARTSSGTVLRFARSIDEGRTFASPADVTGSNAPGNRGWHSIVSDDAGRVHVMWLDHRDTAAQGGGHHQHANHTGAAAVDGTARAQQSQLFVGTLDGSVAARGIARGVCYCCKTAMAAGPDGAIYAAWRHVFANNRRDIAVAVSHDGGASFTQPAEVSVDGWHLDGCPENGPALAVDASRRAHVVWPTLVARDGREALTLFSASTTDGRTFTRRTELPVGGSAFHPQVAVLSDGSLAVVWDETAPEGRRIRVARGRAGNDGAIEFEPLDLSGQVPGAYPTVAATAKRLVVAWSSDRAAASSISVRSVGYQRVSLAP